MSESKWERKIKNKIFPLKPQTNKFEEVKEETYHIYLQQQQQQQQQKCLEWTIHCKLLMKKKMFLIFFKVQIKISISPFINTKKKI